MRISPLRGLKYNLLTKSHEPLSIGGDAFGAS